MIPSTATAPFVPGPLRCARDTPLRASTSGQPVIVEAILDWFRPMVVGVITAAIQDSSDPMTDGAAKEIIRKIATQGCLQPGSDEKLDVKSEGQRSWQSGLLHTLPNLNVPTDTVLILDGIRYRVMSKKDFSVNGYVRYKILQDYNNAPPA